MNDRSINSFLEETTISCNNLLLSTVSLSEISSLADVALGEIHPNDYMPFGSPWSLGTPEQRRNKLHSWYERRLQENSHEVWTWLFKVSLKGKIIGSTNLHSQNFSTSRTVSTGSWLLREWQGKGFGTTMRLCLLQLAFEHIGATRAESEAWEDNIASRRVNEKCGYRVVGKHSLLREGSLATMIQYSLTVKDWRQRSAIAPQIKVGISPTVKQTLLRRVR